ncbi:hypothetical protein IE4803_PB00434 (plasmid) [Rhizobium etli bv. phaseoli str. IE4803]|nr:hypothetical protein IE4803_PB00434 [Rhizobium etli bv. phaseoli str. IE4803]ARQ60885.1 hypothetical protein Kim5_PA00423 [Rhizobium sp. Kim5]
MITPAAKDRRCTVVVSGSRRCLHDGLRQSLTKLNWPATIPVARPFATMIKSEVVPCLA